MDKLFEKRLFEYVYGEFNGWQVIPSESPDFICKKENKPVLGSEITELYHTESDARLGNIENYSLELLNGGDFRHKDDVENIKVDKVKLIKKGEDDGPEINAIISKIPGFDKRVELLMNIIESKEEKVEDYLIACPTVDLIVNDASRFFNFEKYEDFYLPLSRLINKNKILSSKFREIYLITLKQDNFTEHTIVKIPLKLNLFAEDITILEDLLRKHKSFIEFKEKDKLFTILFFCLYKLGYKDVSISFDDEGIGITIGSHLFLYSKKNGKIIRQYDTIPEQIPKGNSISDVNKDVSYTVENISMEILENRKNYKGCVPLFMVAKTV